MTGKPKFFFEPDDPSPDQASTDTFFSALKEAGVIQNPSFDMEPKPAEMDASIKQMSSQVLLLEYGPYQKNYAIHITPIHERKHLKNDAAVRKALFELVTILNEFVPYTVQVDLHLPRSDWKMKVISAVIKDAAAAWNFDSDKLEKDGLPRIFKAIEKIILEG